MIKPLGKYIIVKKDPYVPTAIGGILIPECAERTPRFAPDIFGTVLATGDKCQHVKAGDRVWMRIYAGDEIEYGNDQVTRMREKDLGGVVV